MNPFASASKHRRSRFLSKRRSARRRLSLEQLEPRRVLSTLIELDLDEAVVSDLGEADKIDRLREHLEDVQGLQAVEQAEQLASPLAGLGGDGGEAPLFNDPRTGGDGAAGGSVWSPMDDLFGGGSRPPGRGDGSVGSGPLDAARAHRPQRSDTRDRVMFRDESKMHFDRGGNLHITTWDSSGTGVYATHSIFWRDGSESYSWKRTYADGTSDGGYEETDADGNVVEGGAAAQLAHVIDAGLPLLGRRNDLLIPDVFA